MIVSIQPSTISGIVRAPASKSVMQRACAAALIRGGISFIHHPGDSSDERAALDVIGQLGAEIKMVDGLMQVESRGVIPSGETLNCGESGLCARMFTPLAALSPVELTITGWGSLLSRPMDFFDEVLPQLGVQTSSRGGKLPLQLRGPLQPKDITIDGSLSSQFLTGLLFAYAAAEASGVTISVTGLKSSPYIHLTLEVMEAFGLDVPVREGYSRFLFTGKRRRLTDEAVHFTVEGDWSGAAFLLVAGAIAGRVSVDGLRQNSSQADVKILEVLQLAGAKLSWQDQSIQVEHQPLRAFHFDATDCPDLFPPLVALAANCTGRSVIRGLHRLKFKESDRGITLQKEFEKLGISITFSGDEMHVDSCGHPVVKEPVLDSHHDHRIAMACATACLCANHPVAIRNADAVRKSYPGFWDHLAQLNAAVSLEPFTTG
ncbi:MAG TPA: 3-phosphoshikimate 1-carboxyvinyltransferase, partial [Chitinophagaceae bacterium]